MIPHGFFCDAQTHGTRSTSQILVAWLPLFGAFEIRIELFVTVCTKSVFQWIRCTGPQPLSQFKSCWHICVLVTYDLRDFLFFQIMTAVLSKKPDTSLDVDLDLPKFFWFHFRPKQRKEVIDDEKISFFQSFFRLWVPQLIKEQLFSSNSTDCCV